MTEPRWAADGSDAAVAAHIAAVVAQGDRILAFPGGTTPAPIFALLAALDLSRTTILPGDERRVPVDHPASNFGALQRAFGATRARLLPLTTGMQVPPLDLVWLGVGPDGHVASIFPNVAASRDTEVGVIAVTPDPLPPEAPFTRLTLSLASLASAAEIILVIRGEAKRRVVEGAITADDLPVARLVRAARGAVTIFWSA